MESRPRPLFDTVRKLFLLNTDHKLVTANSFLCKLLQIRTDNFIVVFMIPPFAKFGLLPLGIHWTTWPEFIERFGWNDRRQSLPTGLGNALECLTTAGCSEVFIDGSFVTRKESPNDFDACWRQSGVDIDRLDPVFLDFTNARRA